MPRVGSTTTIKDNDQRLGLQQSGRYNNNNNNMAPKKAPAAPAENIQLGPQAREGENVFGVAHIFASFNDTFVVRCSFAFVEETVPHSLYNSTSRISLGGKLLSV